jgi:hypothetical protein
VTDGEAGPAPAAAPPARVEGAPAAAGRRIVAADLTATAAFVLASAFGVAAKAGRAVAAGVDLALFAAGTVACLVAFAQAVARSRAETITVSGLFFLSGSAPRRPRAWLLGCLGVQVGVAVTAAGLRPFTSLAFGVLVPVWGVGLLGLWGARHGRFPNRPDAPSAGAGR